MLERFAKRHVKFISTWGLSPLQECVYGVCVCTSTRGMASCAPASPSKATPPQPPDVNMTPTLDFIQRSHTCSLGEANVWFHVLEARFSSMSERLQHVHTSISHFDSKCAAVVTDESTTSVSCPPQNVAKTVSRAFTNEQNSLTLTL